ncbi:type I restriction endonuclease subunit R [Leptospira stimsonii]|uniref:Type I restriction enzyme endonuclease subunit n=1 Tax=Leptospira stimsonii TaxID=2202203 RepID=A0ABY2MX39_9LEPT|nr:type I restriction endonuclease subunit R [Leptospira stimsonii]TGK23114.1 type I restriction endonuclease subunit R [Leptospira stimsonii]TGM10880.1 type I restriction endonuclease subunit R [Leptospira stimsonii]
MNSHLTEADVEQISIDLFQSLGYEHLTGKDILPEEPQAQRESVQESFLPFILKETLAALNPKIPSDGIEEAYRKVTRISFSTVIACNHAFHTMLTEGIDVTYKGKERIITDKVRLIDFENPTKNNFHVVSQFTIIEGQHNRRPDLLIFVNGMPLGVIELKNPSDHTTTIWSAYNQLQTYKEQIPGLFTFNEVLIISDGLEARIGSLSSNKERFAVWRTIEGEKLAPTSMTQMEVMIRGVFEKKRFLDLIRFFTVFEREDNGSFIKKIAGYHQYHAVNTALSQTIEASKPKGDRRIGVVWHTQGSGKSLTMTFFAGRAILSPEMQNPTIVIITDRQDLDNQLFGTFSKCKELLRQTPVQAKDRNHLKELLSVASGGVIFTTVQKFFPEEKYDTYPLLSDRRNIIVMADEAHRSQYDFIDGFARHMRDGLPYASFIGFTGTPIELSDKNTRAVFGEYISIYDIQRAVMDKATVPIYYESRLAKLELKESEKPKIDPGFESITEDEEESDKQKLKSKWAAVEALVGAKNRLELVAGDLSKHWKLRLSVMEGKAMIVTMSRRIAVSLYNELIKIHPEWESEDDNKGVIKVIMTGSATDPVEWQKHIRNGKRRKELSETFKDPYSSFKIVIVRDMWLTGFDAPSLHTMYIDKPMNGHGLMQAIARVNRVFKDKAGGLVVDYIGIADSLKSALALYTQSGGKGSTAIDQEEAVAVMLEKYEVVCGLFHGFDFSKWKTGTPTDRLNLLPSALEHILAQKEGKSKLIKTVNELSQAFALSVPHDKTTEIRDDVAFFQTVRSALTKKTDEEKKKSPDEIDFAIRQLISGAVSSNEVIDIFTSVGLNKPDISILTDEFLAEVRGIPQKNLAVELLQKLLKEEVSKMQGKRNLVKTRTFLEMLEASLQKYKNRAIETAQVIEHLIELAKKMREESQRGKDLGLSDDEIAFYDALLENESATREMKIDDIKIIAKELVKSLKSNLKINWSEREQVKALIRVNVKKILKKYGYPPDLQAKATALVLEQAEELYGEWVSEELG